MFIPSFSEIKNISESRYQLALLVAKRARQLNDGVTPLFDDDTTNNVTIAMEEIMNGFIINKED